ncbi:MAG: hypothetical protein E3J87_08455 [Candidatus Cloacimonadota bacterium]|nr:MAG: hypothetical protein E3J87_08455 [Candidatus Cloacimonadota bacterium]
MKKIVYIISFILFSINLSGIEKDSSLVSEKKLYYNYVFSAGIEGYLDDWMLMTYGLAPFLGFEFSTNVSPVLDGIIELSVSRKKGSYGYSPGHGYDYFYQYQYEWYDFTMFYEKIGLGLRLCDRRLGRRTPFLEGGLDAVFAKEWRAGYSVSGQAIGSHLAVGFWGNLHKDWIIQLKGRLQFLAIPIRTDNYYFDEYYHMDFSGVGISIGIGLSK